MCFSASMCRCSSAVGAVVIAASLDGAAIASLISDVIMASKDIHLFVIVS